MREFPLEADPLAERDVKPRGLKSAFTLHGGGTTGGMVEGAEVITEAEFKAVKEGKGVALYLIGTGEYRDTFGRQRETEFCYYLDKSAFDDVDRQRAKSGADVVELRWALAHVHNGTT